MKEELNKFDEMVLSDFYRKIKRHLLIEIFLVLIIVCLIGFLIFIFSNDYIDFHRNKIAPSDRIQEKDILIYKDKIVINISNVSYSSYTNTGSMRPTFDERANGIRIIPQNIDEINLGDLITYSENKSCGENCTKEELIIHRVIKIGSDENGIYFVLKGDNNIISDGKVRFSQIKYKTVIILYFFLGLQ